MEGRPGSSGKGVRILTISDRRGERDADFDYTIIDGEEFSKLENMIRKKFHISSHEKFVIVTADKRIRISDDQSLKNKVSNQTTLIVLQRVDQELRTPVRQSINYLPHYDTIIKSGHYEYYASEGHDPLPFALAELIDNALSAVHFNKTKRTIEVRMYLDGPAKNWTVCVLDNGKGMTMTELNNWAIVRLSKFNSRRNDVRQRSENQPDSPRFLNSDISFFGVGGKQAIFFMGDTVTMVSKAKSSSEVCELTMSKKKFRDREAKKKFIFEDEIISRQPGAYASDDNDFIRQLKREERNKKSFTHVIVTGLRPENFTLLRKDYTTICRELAHVYHYYLHGPHGNVLGNTADTVQIVVSVYKNGTRAVCTDLQQVEDDIQTNFLRTAEDSFEFQVTVPIALDRGDEDEMTVGKKEGVIEGVIRYHPYLYDKETYPSPNPGLTDKSPESDNDEDILTSADVTKQARGNRDIFECYWQGRLIPYTTIKEFAWCAAKKGHEPPPECYNRISGVLFTNDLFKVSTNKLTFMDLGEKLKGDGVMFRQKLNGQYKRTVKMDVPFRNWLKECHRKYDKQIVFCKPGEMFEKGDTWWTKFEEIEWEGRRFSIGDLVRTKAPFTYGTITSFSLPGQRNRDCYATGGEFQLILEPAIIHNGETKDFPLIKLDRDATGKTIHKGLETKKERLPTQLSLDWPEGLCFNQVDGKMTIEAGRQIGPLEVAIKDRSDQPISRLAGAGGKGQRWLGVNVQIIRHGPEKNRSIYTRENMNQMESGGAAYWFEAIDEGTTQLGDHTLCITVTLKQDKTGKPCDDRHLPRKEIQFTVVEGPPSQFTIEHPLTPIRVDVPFSVKILLKDECGNPAAPTPELQPAITCTEDSSDPIVIDHDGVEVQHNALVFKGVMVHGRVGKSKNGREVELLVLLPQLQRNPQKLKINMFPGIPFEISLTHKGKEINLENGTPLKLDVAVKDCAGNFARLESKLDIHCKFDGASDLPVYSMSTSCSGVISLTGPKISIQNMRAEQTISATISLPERDHVKPIYQVIRVKPSKQPSNITMYRVERNGRKMEILSNGEMECTAGEIQENLKFKLLDEAGHTVPINQKIASKINFSWIKKPNIAAIKSGKLPSFSAPTRIDTDPQYYEMSLKDSNVTFSFHVRAVPGEPKTIHFNDMKKLNTLRIGDKFDLNFALKDQHGNTVSTLPDIDSLSLSKQDGGAVELDKMDTSEHGVIIRGVRFTDKCSPGKCDLKICYKDIVQCIKMNLIAGSPVEIRDVSQSPEEIPRVNKGSTLWKHLIFELRDAYGNIVRDKTCKVQLKSDNIEIQSTQPLTSEPNNDGEIVFRHLHINGPCGVHEIRAELITDVGRIIRSIVQICIMPAAHHIDLEMGDSSTGNRYHCTAGTVLPSFDAVVISEDDSIMSTIKFENVKLKMKPAMLTSEPGPSEFEFLPDGDAAGDVAGHYYFRNVKAPVKASSYIIYSQCKLENERVICSPEIEVVVGPGLPVRLVSTAQDVKPPHVLNGKNVKKRTIINNLQLHLADYYDNIFVEQNIGFQDLKFSVESESENELPVPKIETTSKKISVAQGSPGKNGQKYDLVISLQDDDSIKPFIQPFYFYSDTNKQMLMKERDVTAFELRRLKQEIDEHEKREEELKGVLQEAQNDLDEIWAKLDSSSTYEVDDIQRSIRDLQVRADELKKLTRRTCEIPRYEEGDPAIFGKIAHLAEIEDEKLATLLSWHLGSSMDCVVTTTTEKANEIRINSRNRQQVMALDMAHVCDIKMEKNLPHECFPAADVATIRGNPIYARSVLHFPAHENECKRAFYEILGDTLFIEDMASAFEFRQKMRHHIKCPTILTLDGCRLLESGEFGGSVNSCQFDLGGRSFGQPPPKELLEVIARIDLLEHIKRAVENCDEVQKQLHEHQEISDSPQMLKKRQKYEKKRTLLERVEHNIALVLHVDDTTRISTPEPGTETGISGDSGEDVERGQNDTATRPHTSCAEGTAGISKTRRESMRRKTIAEIASDKGQYAPVTYIKTRKRSMIAIKDAVKKPRYNEPTCATETFEEQVPGDMGRMGSETGTDDGEHMVSDEEEDAHDVVTSSHDYQSDEDLDSSSDDSNDDNNDKRPGLIGRLFQWFR